MEIGVKKLMLLSPFHEKCRFTWIPFVFTSTIVLLPWQLGNLVCSWLAATLPLTYACGLFVVLGQHTLSLPFSSISPVTL